MRRLLFYISHVRRNFFSYSAERLERFVFDRCVLEIVDGIKIVEMSQRSEVADCFKTNTVAALNLVKSVDGRRYRRLQREIQYIVNAELLAVANYSRPKKACYVDFGLVDTTGNPEWLSWWYASVLVHEATHGAIYSRLVDYTPALRVRIERLCHTEQKRFAAKSDGSGRLWSEALVPPFDESMWHDSWYSSFWKRNKEILSRLKQARRQHLLINSKSTEKEQDL
jgi:hypothetical protein